MDDGGEAGDEGCLHSRRPEHISRAQVGDVVCDLHHKQQMSEGSSSCCGREGKLVVAAEDIPDMLTGHFWARFKWQQEIAHSLQSACKTAHEGIQGIARMAEQGRQGYLEEALGTDSTGVHNALGNALAVELQTRQTLSASATTRTTAQCTPAE